MYYIYILLKKRITYRWELLFSALGSILYVMICCSLWRCLYQDDLKMIKYMLQYTVFANLVNLIYDKEIMNFWSEKIKSGDFVMDLLKPVNLFVLSWKQELASVISNLIIKGIPLAVVFSPFLVFIGDFRLLLLLCTAVVFSHIMFVLLYAAIGMTSFFITEVWSIGRFLDDTIRLLSGSFIPFALLPSGIKTIADFLPLKYLYSFPIKIVFGDFSTGEIMSDFLALIFWILVFAVINIYIYCMALKKVVINGG